MNYGRSNPYQVKIEENYTYANFPGSFYLGALGIKSVSNQY